ncbi:MAG: methionyl-tRNA formyltransferase [Patescibacteria group bacterium]|nr:methionyl-tRNA formyltransferase [Patescibacteria group bacterium]MDE1988539.1 methionyl-tRNA formyltransferase [Patescibacteria group bacterium]MDE2218450.1 methionyl-tRNA formyltransferase [Patescibacteria group bacterium]
MSNLNFVFFGTSEMSVKVLDILIKNGYTPDLVITTPDKPKGRKMILTPSPIKVFALEHNLKISQPDSLSSYKLSADSYQLFIVASYGKIIPKLFLEIPKLGTLNVHPSLLPKFRGPSPIQSFILSGEEKTGVTIMLMDEQVDHGTIIAQQNLGVELPSELGSSTPKRLNSKQLEEKLAELGGQMLVDVIPKWINGEIKPIEQDHSQATFTKKITKEDGLVDLEKDSPEIIYRKFLAFQPWPGIYYFTEKNDRKTRVIITDMELSESGELKIKKVKPEGKKEMDYDNFLKV